MRLLIFIFITTILICCNSSKEKINSFQLDAQTDSIVNKTVDAMGGYQKWKAIHYISWTFFGRRDLIWDKYGNRVRIDSPGDSSIYILNMDDMSGRVLLHGQEVMHSDSLSKYLNIAKRIWINDSYWLAMPFKLEDKGVSTKYVRSDTTLVGSAADVLQLTFDGVGVTPQNKYEVYVDKKTDLILQWAFFRDVNQETDPAIWPWDNYKEFNGVLISGNRSDGRGPSNVKVFDALGGRLFEDFTTPSF
ncbi:MAG: hypothetical protein ACJA01_004579 [Saprospiraceae bacterium]|jgi:hypothetical protein